MVATFILLTKDLMTGGLVDTNIYTPKFERRTLWNIYINPILMSSMRNL